MHIHLLYDAAYTYIQYLQYISMYIYTRCDI